MTAGSVVNGTASRRKRVPCCFSFGVVYFTALMDEKRETSRNEKHQMAAEKSGRFFFFLIITRLGRQRERGIGSRV